MSAFLDLDLLYARYASDRSPDRLDDLLTGVRSTVVHRYQKRYRKDVEDIAQRVTIKIWRVLECGDLKPYDPNRSPFARFVDLLAKSTLVDFYKRDRLLATADWELEDIVESYSSYSPIEMARHLLATFPAA